jgi:hypothetical protein
LAHACIDLVGVIARNSPTHAQIASLRILAIPADEIIPYITRFDWVECRDRGQLSLTAAGIAVSAIGDIRLAIRAVLRAYIENLKPAWVKLASGGRRELLLQAPPGVRQVFCECGMAYGYEDDVVEWWDMLANESRRERDTFLNKIGRLGEQRSLLYEEWRTGRAPSWTSVESNFEGYDILSTRSRDDPRRLTIEVKTSKQSLEAAFFFLSRNEWDYAQGSIQHVFHLWRLDAVSAEFAILTVEDVAPHIPADIKEGVWQLVRIPYLAFRDSFTPLSIR